MEKYLVDLTQNELINVEAGSWLSNKFMEGIGFLVGTNTAICMYNAPYAPWVGQAVK